MSDDFGHFDCEVCDEARTREHHLEIIRAFVERVDSRITRDTGFTGSDIWGAIQDELAAMEKEAE
jgi:hypothetical protein